MDPSNTERKGGRGRGLQLNLWRGTTLRRYNPGLSITLPTPPISPLVTKNATAILYDPPPISPVDFHPHSCPSLRLYRRFIRYSRHGPFFLFIFGKCGWAQDIPGPLFLSSHHSLGQRKDPLLPLLCSFAMPPCLCINQMRHNARNCCRKGGINIF